MSGESEAGIRPVTIALIVAAIITILLGIAVAMAFFRMRSRPITIFISSPPGEVVLCDLVIDGRPESRRDTAPVTYTFHARQLDFAVIPETEDAGNVIVSVNAAPGKGSGSGQGFRGTATVKSGMGSVSLGSMAPQHVENMRASRADIADENDAPREETAPPPADPAASSTAR